MPEGVNYQDIELGLVAWVKTLDGVLGADNRTPGTFTTANTPFVRVANSGGPDDGITDFPRIDFDVFALSRTQAREISEAIRTALRPRMRVGSAIIDSVRTSTSPRELPWSNEKMKRYSATYALGLRR